VQALIRTAESIGQPLKVLNAVEEANDAQKRVLLDKIALRFGNELKGMNFALWGLAFKPNTDDMREASSRVVIQGLWEMGATVTVYDPVAMDESRRIFGDDARLRYADSPMEALEGADALIIVTEWKEFRAPDFARIKAALKTPAIFDGRNMYTPSIVKSYGLEYSAIGRR
jgi:UDPglucose 6-dehydrogenase